MAAPFCTVCGAAVAEGTRFCVKCGQPVQEAAPAPPGFAAPPPPPASFQTAPIPAAPMPAAAIPAAPIMMPPQPVKEGVGAGVWIGILGILLLLGGAGLWFYTARSRVTPVVQVAATPAPAPSAPEVIPPNPDFAQKEVIPPNPDFAPKDQAPPAAPAQPAPPPARPKVQAVQPATDSTPAPSTAAPSAPAPSRAVKAASPTSGVLHAAVEVAQNGEVVFENLPGARLRFTFDHDAWKPTISHQPNGTQTLVMRSLKPGIQTRCDVSWEIVQ